MAASQANNAANLSTNGGKQLEETLGLSLTTLLTPASQ